MEYLVINVLNVGGFIEDKMEIQNYTFANKGGLKVKTNFKDLREEQDWLFHKHYYLQIIYDDKFKKTKKWNTLEATKLRLLINTMRVREIDLKEITRDLTFIFFKKYRDELKDKIIKDSTKLYRQTGTPIVPTR